MWIKRKNQKIKRRRKKDFLQIYLVVIQPMKKEMKERRKKRKKMNKN